MARDYAEAVGLCRIAAERGNPNVEDALGGMYEGGRGVERDLAKR